MALLEYEGYIARIDIDEDAGTFHGRVMNITDIVNFKGGSMSALKKEFSRSMKEYFALCRERGEKPDKPFSGRFVLRVDPSVHRAITRAADREGQSINRWAEQQLEIAARRRAG